MTCLRVCQCGHDIQGMKDTLTFSTKFDIVSEKSGPKYLSHWGCKTCKGFLNQDILDTRRAEMKEHCAQQQ